MVHNLGPHKDVPAPDVNTTPEIMAWMVDEYEKLTGDTTGATFTGKPLDRGGSEGRSAATGMGGFYVFDALRKKLGLPEKCTVVIQGFGNVGSNAAEIFANHGHIVMAVSDSKGGIYNKNGLDIKELVKHKSATGSLSGFPNATEITNEELLKIPCDLLVPAAFENVITEHNAPNLRAKALLELANGPVTPEADEILFKASVPVIPDVLANSGGVTVSYFEWDQNLTGEHWTEVEVNEKLRGILDDSSQKVFETSQNLSTDLRRSAFVLALERIQEKMIN
jgi:glutamate dehydrogenase (NAD(P)+)